jgi:hypothetical protein
MALPIIVTIGGIAIKYATKELAEQAVKNIGGKLISNPSAAVVRKALSPRKALTNNPTLLDKIKSQVGISPKQSKSMPLVGRSDKNAGINVGKLERTASERRSQLKVGIPLAFIAGKIGYDMGKDKDTKKTTTKSSDKAVSGNYAMDESANKPVNKNKTDRPTVTKPKATERTYERYRKEPKPVPKGLREGIAKDKNKVTPKVEDTKKQLMMKEKYSGKDSNVKFNAKGGMMKKYSKGGMTKKGKK